jgi:hypothetical protein
MLEQKCEKPNVLRERVPLRFTRNPRLPLQESMFGNKAKSEPQILNDYRDLDIICSKITPDK